MFRNIIVSMRPSHETILPNPCTDIVISLSSVEPRGRCGNRTKRWRLTSGRSQAFHLRVQPPPHPGKFRQWSSSLIIHGELGKSLLFSSPWSVTRVLCTTVVAIPTWCLGGILEAPPLWLQRVTMIARCPGQTPSTSDSAGPISVAASVSFLP